MNALNENCFIVSYLDPECSPFDGDNVEDELDVVVGVDQAGGDGGRGGLGHARRVHGVGGLGAGVGLKEMNIFYIKVKLIHLKTIINETRRSPVTK